MENQLPSWVRRPRGYGNPAEATSPTLLGRLAAGADGRAWEQFVVLYTPLLTRWSRRLGLSDADTADFVQDVFVVLVQCLPRFRYDARRSFRAWLKTILLNAWRKQVRRAAAAPRTGGDPDHIPDLDPTALVDEAEHNDFLVRRALELARAGFEPTTWKACWEFVVAGRPAEAVAAELGLTVNAVYIAKSRVLRHLRTELAGLVC